MLSDRQFDCSASRLFLALVLDCVEGSANAAAAAGGGGSGDVFDTVVDSR